MESYIVQLDFGAAFDSVSLSGLFFKLKSIGVGGSVLPFAGRWNVYLWTPLCYFVAIFHLVSKSMSIVLRCGGQLLNFTFSLLSIRCIRWPGFVPIRVSCRYVIDFVWLHGLSMLYKINLNSHCLFSELPSATTRVRPSQAAAAAHPLEFEVSKCRTSRFARNFLLAQVRMWNGHPYLQCVQGCSEPAGWVQGCNQSSIASLSCVFFRFPWRRWLWGCESNL